MIQKTHKQDKQGTLFHQLAALPEGDHAAACLQERKQACERPVCCIASPPYAHDAEPHGDLRPNSKIFIERSYGREQGQLAQMPTGDHAQALEPEAERPQCAISSPPWEASLTSKDEDFLSRKFPNGNQALDAAAGYGSSKGQLGQETGSTFWAASRTILEEVYKMLTPGGHAIFVCKRFVRSKKIVDFPLQWARLCEAVGFKWIHHHKAWLVEDRGAQHTLEGGLEKRVVKRFSFFRRIHSQNFPELEISWEDVLCFVKE